MPSSDDPGRGAAAHDGAGQPVKLLHALSLHATALAEKTALIDDHGTATYAELAEAVAKLAALMSADGVQPGDVVALAIEPDIPGVCLLLGTIAAGAVAAPVNTRLAQPEVDAYLARIQPGARAVDRSTGVSWAGARSFDRTADDGAVSGRLGLGEDDAPPWPELADGAGAVAIPTGGTTGTPKAALWSRGGLSDCIVSNCIHLGLRRSDRELYVASLFHITIVAALLPTLYVGGTVRLTGRFDADRVTPIFEAFAPTRILCTPTVLSRIIERLRPTPELADLQITIVYGAARNAPDFRHRVLALFPRARLITGYGATEHGPVARLFPTEPEAGQAGALGRPTAEASIRIVDDAGGEVPTGEIGELVVQAPWQMLGYLGGADGRLSPDGAIHSGDLGWQDQAGCFFLSGRSKELIKTGGENVFPTEVEDVLQQHPAVADVAVYGMDDDRWGERVEAAVVVAAGMTVSAEELKEHCTGRLAGFKIPKRFRTVDALPYTPNMKLDRRRLQADATNEQE